MMSFLSSQHRQEPPPARILNPPDFGGLASWENTTLVKESDQNVGIPQKFIAGLYELRSAKPNA
jgi:hypothetical protein